MKDGLDRFGAKKSLGQHFLFNNDLARRIVGVLKPESGDNILEIGPGKGALTTILEAAPHARLLPLEKDRNLARAGIYGHEPGTRIINIDALRFPWGRLARLGKWKLIGNLPYNIASPLIWDIARDCRALSKAVFMVQKEVGLRLVAKPGTSAYGGLSVWVGSFLIPRLEFCLPPGAFQPPPKVDSAVISFTPVLTVDLPARPAALARLIHLSFQSRRKQLGGIFRRAGLSRLADSLKSLDIDPASRPENLTCKDFQTLSEIMASNEPGLS